MPQTTIQNPKQRTPDPPDISFAEVRPNGHTPIWFDPLCGLRHLSNFRFARAFAESNNTLSTVPLRKILHRRVHYVSRWRGVEVNTRRDVLLIFDEVYEMLRAELPAARLYAQVAGLDGREAVVLVGSPTPDSLRCIVRFTAPGRLARGVLVETRIERDRLRCFDFYPPES